MAWTPVAAVGELNPGQMKRVEAGGRKLLLCHADSGHYCIDEMCSHEDYSLWFGCLKGDTIKCSLHGSYFSLDNGQPLNDPADCALATYPVKIDQGQVWIDVD